MSIIFGGGEMSAFTPSDSTVIERTSTSGLYSQAYNSSFARACIEMSNDTTYAEGTPSASSTDIWYHFDLMCDNAVGTTSTTRFRAYDSSGNERLRLAYNDDGHIVTINYWNGSAFVAAGTFSLNLTFIRQTIDINVVCNSASGLIACYVAGTERLGSPVINTSSITNLKKFRFVGATISSVSHYETMFSQVIVTDGVPTVGWRGVVRYANGAGATNDWTGAYTEIDEAIYSDADFINSSVADQVELFTNTGPSVTGYTIRAVCVSSRARRGASGPSKMRHALRSAGTTYFSSGDISLTVGYAPTQTIWEQDPATTSDWLTGALTTLQFGVKSIT